MKWKKKSLMLCCFVFVVCIFWIYFVIFFSLSLSYNHWPWKHIQQLILRTIQTALRWCTNTLTYTQTEIAMCFFLSFILWSVNIKWAVHDSMTFDVSVRCLCAWCVYELSVCVCMNWFSHGYCGCNQKAIKGHDQANNL